MHSRTISNLSSALAGASALALVMFTSSAAKQSGPRISSGSVYIRNFSEVRQTPLRIDMEIPQGFGGLELLLYKVPDGKTLVLDGHTGKALGGWVISRIFPNAAHPDDFWHYSLSSDPTNYSFPNLIFNAGEDVVLYLYDGGNAPNQEMHKSFSGYLVDA